MADLFSGHVARRIMARSVDYFTQAPGSVDTELDQVNTPQDVIKQIPTWGVVLFVTTIVLFVAMLASVRYTLGKVVTTLAMIESPTVAAYVEAPQDDLNEKSDGLLGKDEMAEDIEVVLVKQRPLTSKIRTIIRHLHNIGGFRARWRGFSAAVVYSLASATLTFSTMPILTHPLASIFSAITLALLSTTWTHIVISNPSSKPWYRRVPDSKAWRKVFPATAIFAIAAKATMYLPLGVAYALGLTGEMSDSEYLGNLDHCSAAALAGKVLAVITVGIFTFVAVYIPAKVTLTRVQASLLPEEEETIVPFDRTFGGKVVPEIAGGSGVVGLLDAWKTFDWPSRFRLLKLYGKIFAIIVTLHILMLHVLFYEAYLIMGDNMFEAMRSMRR